MVIFSLFEMFNNKGVEGGNIFENWKILYHLVRNCNFHLHFFKDIKG